MNFDEIKDALSDFSPRDFAQKKPFTFALICFLTALFIAGLVVLLIQTSPEKKSEAAAPEHFEADAPILIPDAPQIEKDYYPSRITENQWQKDEVDKWFTYPDEDVMKDLAESNDKIVKDIIGAAP